LTSIPLYDGALQANRVGAFIKGGRAFDVIRPGFDSQARKHKSWTQIVHEGVPVFTVKLLSPLEVVLARFEELWADLIGDDADLLARALEMSRNDHLRRFKDGVTGETPAPSLTRDGRDQGQSYPS
jgi:hypothetical protein